jgi:hypothetical protein
MIEPKNHRRTRAEQVCRVALALLGLALVALAPAGVATAQGARSTVDYKGSEFFCRLLHDVCHLKPLSGIAELHARYTTPPDTVLIVFGGLRCLDDFATNGLKAFVDAGGSILIASDRPDFKHRLHEFKIDIPGPVTLVPDVNLIFPGEGGETVQLSYSRETIQLIRDEVGWRASPFTVDPWIDRERVSGEPILNVSAEYWKNHRAVRFLGFRDCMRVESYFGSTHPLFERCTHGIVTNRASFLRGIDGPAAENRCCLPPYPVRDEVSWQWGVRWCRFEMEPAFAAWFESHESPGLRRSNPSGRVLFVSGHGLFMNGTIVQPNSDNRQFAINALNWLSEGRRRYALFFEENQAVTHFDVPLMPLPIPQVRVIDYALRDMEERNVFNNAILEAIPKRILLGYLAGAALVVLLVLGLRRLIKAGYQQDANVPLVEARIALAVRNYLPPLLMRQKVLAAANDFLEPARIVARTALEEAAGELDPSGPPRMRAGTAAAARHLQHAADVLWHLVFQRANRPMSAGDFGNIVNLAADLREARARGKKRINES